MRISKSAYFSALCLALALILAGEIARSKFIESHWNPVIATIISTTPYGRQVKTDYEASFKGHRIHGEFQLGRSAEAEFERTRALFVNPADETDRDVVISGVLRGRTYALLLALFMAILPSMVEWIRAKRPNSSA